MKRILLFGVLMMVGGGELMAAQQCVKFGDLTEGLYIASSGQSDWTVYNSDIKIVGIAVCASTFGQSGDVADSLEYDMDLLPGDTCGYMLEEVLEYNKNTYCWCRMLSPAVSKWVAYGDLWDAEECLDNCSEECAAALITSTAFRSAMLGSLGG